MLTPFDAAALAALDENRQGLFGDQFPAITTPRVGFGVIYTVLERLVDAGWVRELVEDSAASSGLPRTRHFITDSGISVLREHQAGASSNGPIGAALSTAS